jgi:hypothetical protein
MKNSPPTRKTPSSRPSLLPPDGKSRVRSLLKNCFGVEFQKLITGMWFDLLSRQRSAVSFQLKTGILHLVEADG